MKTINFCGSTLNLRLQKWENHDKERYYIKGSQNFEAANVWIAKNDNAKYEWPLSNIWNVYAKKSYNGTIREMIENEEIKKELIENLKRS